MIGANAPRGSTGLVSVTNNPDIAQVIPEITILIKRKGAPQRAPKIETSFSSLLLEPVRFLAC